jgi:hypothetical protein
MNSEWPQRAVLRAASLLAPGDQRAEWMEEWRSELWYVPRCRAMVFALGAFRDALWLRRHQSKADRLSRVKRSGTHLESPLSCLALLATLAAASLFIAVRLERMLPFPEDHGAPSLRAAGTILLFFLPLATVAFTIAYSSPMPQPRKLRGWIFLGLKIALALPILQGGVLAMIVVAPGAMGLSMITASVLLFRWVFADQQRRCPECLQLLTKPVRIGTPSQTFLEWYGGESVCARGHGILHVPEISCTHSRKAQWLRLDDSWSGLFAKGGGR